MSTRKIDRVARLAANPFAQPDIRSREMQRLLDDGSPEALSGVLRRFAANAQGQIADEEEKTWLQGVLVELGRDAVGPLSQYIRGASKLSYALAAYQRIVGDAEAASFFVAVLAAYGPDDHRSAEAKVQLVAAVAECAEQSQCLEALVPHLADHSDDVRWAVLEAIAGRLGTAPLPAAAEPVVMPALLNLLGPGGASARIAHQAATILAARPWPLPVERALAPAVGAHFAVGEDRRLRARS